MSRSAKDATRFTATAPHAYSRAGPSPSSRATAPGARNGAPSFQSAAAAGEPVVASSGTGETPSQKVSRLRAEHLRRKIAQMSMWEKVVVRGRRVADTLHVWTVFGLLSLSVVTAGITIFSLGDMIMYNRRKKKEFMGAYQKLWEQRYDDALKAQAMGTATESQLALIKQERDAEQADLGKDTRTYWQRAKGAFGTQGLSKDAGGTQSWRERPELLEGASLNAAQDKSGILAALDEQRRTGEKQLERAGYGGGQLDQMAQDAAAKAAAEMGGGLSASKWFMWGPKKSQG